MLPSRPEGHFDRARTIFMQLERFIPLLHTALRHHTTIIHSQRLKLSLGSLIYSGSIHTKLRGSRENMGQSWSAPRWPANSTETFDSKRVPYWIAYGGAWYGMLFLAVSLLILCALLAGLTLALCGLNTTLLQLRGVTGTPKQRHVFFE